MVRFEVENTDWCLR